MIARDHETSQPRAVLLNIELGSFYSRGDELAPLRAFAEKKKFSWLNDARGYWHSDMFAEHSVSAPSKRQALSIDA
jgi:hypothetical protein